MRRGMRVADRFEVLEHAGSGGMGTVYKAQDTTTKKTVAVKLLTLTEGVNTDRFLRECKMLSELSHPGIVGYVDHGMWSGRHYLAMEWADGRTLSRTQDQDGIDVGQTLTLAIHVGRALETMHRKGLVHRDVKPSNLMFPAGDVSKVKLLDFGLARKSEDEIALTRSGLMVGSPGYMSPEQARGEREVSPAADVFSLGAVLWECLTGKPAFEGADPIAIRTKVLMIEPPLAHTLNADVPRELSALLAAMLHKRADGRPKTGGQVAAWAERIAPPAKSERRKRSRAANEAKTVAYSDSASRSSTSGGTPEGRRQTAELEIPKQAEPRSHSKTDVSDITPPARPSAPPSVSQFVILMIPEPGAPLDVPQDLLETISLDGGRVEILEGGQLVAVFSGTRSPEVEAGRAARVALTLRKRIPGPAMAMVADCSRSPDLGELIERGAKSITAEAVNALVKGEFKTMGGKGMSGIKLDTTAQDLLGTRFAVEIRASGAYLKP